MKTSILTQKNVCAFIGLVMAIMIVWSANAQASTLKNDSTTEKTALTPKSNAPESSNLVLELPSLKEEPTAVLINKYGDVVAEFYGEMEEIKVKFSGLFEKCDYITKSGKQSFYLKS
ncbi:hypothetical protein ACFOUP_08345 [Belliella kenyensis]|uniref:Uncharacterized protein n=1 Tax=Belliella kenyensis TaxID=1472724 RepID=A0ABV8EM04_9BACT|nr:hypothetical protein [Belliella kenyensis]MCH7403305.1 hypothetical protein [Belliella kenyensis]MDN3602946.1 hypothetical protein [Belliella kenyensis]